ncbi:hypothetical protein BD324DRAFT_624054 [Kockovaella imperatae]|uniref:Uncharacterized protein n=1 Tax=Kockovaella imperatae TaxID=4999 RepID=A0A1Y1UKB9_9TREE|nr:hypothetical protein BD324DRAFT_624054 [Kockovaella imperatae]ORX37987.1 hypothetical protein BD324DRAFT_624054 [Kockovaella imperatae]
MSSLPSLTFVSLLLLHPALALYNLTYTDQSRLIVYEDPIEVGPFYDENGTSLDNTTSWTCEYTNTSLNSLKKGDLIVGKGVSSHWTEQESALVSFQFQGDAIYALGYIGPTGGGRANPNDPPVGGYGSTQLTVNGQNYGPYNSSYFDEYAEGGSDISQDYLNVAENLGTGWHSAELAYKGSGRFTFEGFTVSMPLNGSIKTSQLLVNGSNGPFSINQAISTTTDSWGVTNISYTEPGIEVATTEQYATLSFQVPTNTSVVILYGNASPVDGNYSVSLSSPAAQNTADSNAYPPANQSIVQPSEGLSPWYGLNVIQYVRILDPDTDHTITVEKLSPRGFIYGLNYATFISADTTLSSGTINSGSNSTSSTSGGNVNDSGSGAGHQTGSKSHVGAIVGGMAGGVAALALIAGLFWYFDRKRRHRQEEIQPTPLTEHKAGADAFEVDDNRGGYSSQESDLRTYQLTEVPHSNAATDMTPIGSSSSGTDTSTLAAMTEKQAALFAEIESSRANTSSPGSSPVNTVVQGQTSRTSLNTRQSPPALAPMIAAPAQNGPLRLANAFDAPTSPESDTSNVASDEQKPAGSVGSSSVPPNRRRRRAPLGAGDRGLVQEVDAGRVSDEVERLPPSYDPTWSRQNGEDGQGGEGQTGQ